MEYEEFLEHMETLLRAWVNDIEMAQAFGSTDAPMLDTVRRELQNERKRGELAQELTDKDA